LGISDRVIFTGGVPRSSVLAYLKAADLFILNSSYEGLPHIILEAFASGLPVVATSAGGTQEVVEDGVNGLLVPPRQPEILAAAVDRIFSDHGLRTSLIQGGRRTLQTRFLWETMVEETESVLRDAAFLAGAAR
jgi:glycosyltransferase involved in cell wall biosynthesis